MKKNKLRTDIQYTLEIKDTYNYLFTCTCESQNTTDLNDLNKKTSAT